MKHTEDSRVKIPALLHFLRLGYKYQSKVGVDIDSRNNIFVEIFKDNIKRINGKDYKESILTELIDEIAKLTDNEIDKGGHFFDRLIGFNKIKLIDLENPEKNDFRVVTELTYKKGDMAFRPDITILVNGIPLGFIEVKKPNNQGGIQAEFTRMKRDRFPVSEFRQYFNQLQVLGFSNNQPYDDDARNKMQGSFYTTPNFEGTRYNNFREEMEIAVKEYISPDDIKEVLEDNNLIGLDTTEEFKMNLKPKTYTNRFITSVYSIERFIFFIRYGIVYVDSSRDGLHKHIIRYPQLFSLKNMMNKIDNGMKRGIFWLSPGSGKTALGYYATNVLRDYFQKKNIITKFYFVVDRLDLLNQATDEFSFRGMSISEINSRKKFAENIKSSVITGGSSGDDRYKETMNVVNIQKFSDESTVDLQGNRDIQRIYFLDEVHRGYKPKGTFLANLLGADPSGIFMGLTGTPLLNKDVKSTDIFSEYIHKYYYNKSIADGYTLKIKKENIATHFKNDVRDVLGIKEGEHLKSKDWEYVTKQSPFIEKLCNYVIEDFNNFKEVIKDDTLGSMIVSSSSDQARAIKEWFDNNSEFKSALVLYDEEENKVKQENFRGEKNKDTGEVESEYHGVLVYNMLLTGFDAPRLKKLYLLREIKEHSLLQTLARVNRPYKNMKYGYIVDFVDITEQYEETNRRYLEELKADIADDDDTKDITDMFVDVEKVKAQVKTLEGKLFDYMWNIEKNLEAFRHQIAPLDEKELRVIKGQLDEYRECYNELRMSHEDVSKIPIDRLNKAFYEVTNRINLKIAERIINDPDADVTEIDLSKLIIEFIKSGEMDLEFATEDDVLEKVNKLKNALQANMDKLDEKYIELNKQSKEILKSFKNSQTIKEVQKLLNEMELLHLEVVKLNTKNTALTNRYKGNDSCMRIHKRLVEQYNEDLDDASTYVIMTELIEIIDERLNSMKNPSEVQIINQLKRPIRDTFKNHAGVKVTGRMAENIAKLFADDTFA